MSTPVDRALDKIKEQNMRLDSWTLVTWPQCGSTWGSKDWGSLPCRLDPLHFGVHEHPASGTRWYGGVLFP